MRLLIGKSQMFLNNCKLNKGHSITVLYRSLHISFSFKRNTLIIYEKNATSS